MMCCELTLNRPSEDCDSVKNNYFPVPSSHRGKELFSCLLNSKCSFPLRLSLPECRHDTQCKCQEPGSTKPNQGPICPLNIQEKKRHNGGFVRVCLNVMCFVCLDSSMSPRIWRMVSNTTKSVLFKNESNNHAVLGPSSPLWYFPLFLLWISSITHHFFLVSSNVCFFCSSCHINSLLYSVSLISISF